MNGRVSNKMNFILFLVVWTFQYVFNVSGDCEPFPIGVSDLYVYSSSVFAPFGPYKGDVEKDVSFWCVKPKSKTFQETFLNDSQIGEKIDFNLKIAFLIHGYTDSFKLRRNGTGWMEPTALIWSEIENTNVCAVDWNPLTLFNYPTAEKNTQIAGAYLGLFIQFLEKNGADVAKMIAAGHSLGAHVAGLAGKFIGAGRLDMIIGIDPAGFGLGISPPNVRLDASDAKFVQTMHTSFFGFLSPGGHAMFILNTMGFLQPGCSPNPGCNHGRAIYYFVVSLLYKFKGISEQCTDLFSCTPVEDIFGPRSEKIHGKFYVRTGSCFPYIT